MPAAHERKTATVLIVDDDEGMRALLRKFLEREGYRVVDAGSAAQAMSLIDIQPLDVAILDKEMPGMNGMELLSMLRKRIPGTPVILVTAFGGPRVAEEARGRGAYDYVEKPFRVGRIVKVIESVTRLESGS